MKQESKLNYAKVITLEDAYNTILSKILVIMLIGIIAFSVFFAKGIYEKKKFQAEIPTYRCVLNISIDYDFLDTSILTVAKNVFTEEAFTKIRNIENFKMSSKYILNRVYYSAESKRNISVIVYSADKDTGIRTLNGVINVIVPKLSSELNKSDVNYDFVEINKRVKIIGLDPKENKELISINDLNVTSWENYESNYSIKTIFKNAFLVSFYSMFIYIVVLLLNRFFSRKVFSIRDVKNITGVDVIAVSDNKCNGTHYILERIKAQRLYNNEKIGFLPVLYSEKMNNTIRKILSADDNDFFVIDALSNSYDILKKVDKCNEIIIFYECGKTTFIELQNTVNLLKNISEIRIFIVCIGVHIKEIEKNKEYFGKFYRDV